MTDTRLASNAACAGQRGARPILFSLQYLRGFAALMVIYFHAVLQIRLLTGAKSFFPLIGAGGVDIFFVLSGFMMWYVIEQKPLGGSAFLRQRIVRVVPLYWAVTAVALVVACMVPSLLRSTAFDLHHAIASLLFLPWPNPALAAMGAKDVLVPVLVPGWTLNFEMMFYLLFAATLWMAKSLRLPALGLMIAGVYWISGSVGTVSPLSFYHRDMLFEFLAGAVLGALQLERRPLSAVVVLCFVIAGFSMMVGAEVLFDEPKPRILLLGVPALLILIGALRGEAGGVVPSWRLLAALGDASFSIYLIHGFVLAALRVAAARMGVASGAGSFQIAFLLAALVISAMIGLGTYYKVERPLVRMAGRLLSQGGSSRQLQAA